MGSHIMVDCETLGIFPNAVILTIGACIFDPKGSGVMESIDLRPSVDEQIGMGREVDENTLKWWSSQNDAAQYEALGDHDRVPFRVAMERLHKFCWNRDAVWSHGAAFDVVLMENAWRSFDMAEPWPYHKVRDTRTLFDITGVSLKDGGYVTTHRASEDAARQAFIVQKAYKILMKAG